MKYTIEGYSQKKLIENGLDCTDAIILRWYADFQLSGNMKEIEINKEKYYWLKYDKLMEEIPIIGISNKIALARRLKKLILCGILEHKTHKVKGTFSCYRITKKYYELLSNYSKLTEKSDPSNSRESNPSNSRVRTNNSSIRINSSIKDSGKGSDKSDPSYKQLKDVYNNKLLDIGYDQEFINRTIFQIAPQRAQLSNLIKLFKNEYEFNIFLEEAFKEEFYKENYVPKMLISQFSNIMMKCYRTQKNKEMLERTKDDKINYMELMK